MIAEVGKTCVMESLIINILSQILRRSVKEEEIENACKVLVRKHEV
jgi:hypothetical protein